MKRIQLLIPVLGVALIIAFSAFYIVDEREKALRLWFGEVTAEIEEPGLYFKIPLFHEIVKYDDRILALDTLYVNTIALVILFGLKQGSMLYFEAALLIAIMGFIGTIALSKYLLRGDIIE